MEKRIEEEYQQSLESSSQGKEENHIPINYMVWPIITGRNSDHTNLSGPSIRCMPNFSALNFYGGRDLIPLP